MELEIEGISIEWIRKPIRRLHLRVYPHGRVVVSAPWLMPRQMVENFVWDKSEWIIHTRTRLMAHPPRPLPAVTGEQATELATYLNERVEYWRIRMGEQPVTWKTRNMKSQWGNCRAVRRLLTFNLQLALVPDELKDYIIVHELSHLKVQNHGPMFKARVSEFMPDWRERRKQLKEYVTSVE